MLLLRNRPDWYAERLSSQGARIKATVQRHIPQAVCVPDRYVGEIAPNRNLDVSRTSQSISDPECHRGYFDQRPRAR
jgi:hypothetical protein